MLKVLNVITLTLFIFIASIAPYSAANGAALAFSENTEERDLSTQIYEEEIFHQKAEVFFMKITVKDLYFPHYITLCPQIVFLDILKPPLA